MTTDFVTIEGRTLSKAMRLMTAIVERRNTYPVLSTVKLTADFDRSSLWVEGTDLDIEAKTEIDAIDVMGTWTICVDARLIAGIAKAAGNQPMRMERLVSENNVKGKDGKSGIHDRIAIISLGNGDVTYELHDLTDPDAWPAIAGDRGAEIERFTNGHLTALLGKVAWCISTEETRYYLNGVCWQDRTEGKRMVATDGHRLAACRYDSPAAGARADDRIIPRKTVAILMKHTAGENVTAYAVTNKECVDFVFDRTSIRSKMIEGTFPDVDRVIPKGAANFQFALNREEVMTAIGQAMVCTSRNSGRALHFHGAPGQEMTIGAKHVDLGTAKVKLSTEWPATDKGIPAPDFGFNGRYLQELLARCEGNIIIHQGDAGSPYRVTDDDPTMTRVIMPMRV